MKKVKSQTGRSMVEILGVIAIIGVLSVGGVAYYNYAMQKNKMNQALKSSMLIAVNTMSFFKEQDLKDHVGELDEHGVEKLWDITQQGKDYGFVNDKQNPWAVGSQVEVFLNKKNETVSVPTIEVVYKDVPEFACQRMGFQNTDDLLYIAIVDENGNEVADTKTMAGTPEEFIAKCKALVGTP